MPYTPGGNKKQDLTPYVWSRTSLTADTMITGIMVKKPMSGTWVMPS